MLRASAGPGLPDRYGYQQWRLDTLPIIPGEWIFEPCRGKNVMGQIKTIKLFAAKASEIVHAGDSGRERQFLVDEVLDHLAIKKPVKHIRLPLRSREG